MYMYVCLFPILLKSRKSPKFASVVVIITSSFIQKKRDDRPHRSGTWWRLG